MSLAIVIGSLAVACSHGAASRSWPCGVRGDGADARVVEAVQRLADGMQDTMRELADAVSEAQAAGRQASFGSAET